VLKEVFPLVSLWLLYLDVLQVARDSFISHGGNITVVYSMYLLSQRRTYDELSEWVEFEVSLSQSVFSSLHKSCSGTSPSVYLMDAEILLVHELPSDSDNLAGMLNTTFRYP